MIFFAKQDFDSQNFEPEILRNLVQSSTFLYWPRLNLHLYFKQKKGMMFLIIMES